MGNVLYTYTGGYQTFTVPAGVTSLTVTLNGGSSASGIRGGRVSGKLAVTAGRKLTIVVGQGGGANSSTTGGRTAWGAGAAGGNGKANNGGDGGSGYSGIRFDSSTGTIKAIAGGAGGDSGDGGRGGEGGASIGQSGGRGSSGTNSTGNATGGTQTQGGNGGTSSSGSPFNGANASDTTVGIGGRGGSADNASHGGGGGGGGYKSGGGGQASSAGYAPGGGGGGGSSYTGGLSGASSTQGGSTGTGNGEVRVEWTDPPPVNQPPTPPTAAQVNGVDEAEDMPTKATSTVTVSAIVNDPDSSDSVRLLVRYSTSSAFTTYTDRKSGLVTRGHRASYAIGPLTQNTHYFVRLYSQDEHGKYSTGYNTLSFWTNRPPQTTLTAPEDNTTVDSIDSVVFAWTVLDPDPSDARSGFSFRYRRAADSANAAGPWVTHDRLTNSTTTITFNPLTFKGNTFYEWSVRTKDAQGLWGDWAVPFSFFASAVSTPPRLVSPVGGVARATSKGIAFRWTFVDPDPGDAQRKADIRYRVIGLGDDDWTTVLGTEAPDAPGAATTWTLPPEQFVPGYGYEWQVRTYDVIGLALASDWSASGFFYAIKEPGWAVVGQPVPVSPLIQGSLGCGTYRAFVYEQGGQRMVGEIEPLSQLNFKRIRDGISNAIVFTNGYGEDCCALYASLRCWMHELVIFRDGERVWEGPITRLGYEQGRVEIEARDVMVYCLRRIMRQGYNDAYQKQTGEQDLDEGGLRLGLSTSVDRAAAIIINALAPYDPNILAYLTAIRYADDAQQSRVVPDYSQTAAEQVDSLAATAGLDYTVIGRRILLWDTHRSIGRLPEMRDGDFSDPPIVTEYGMQMCNYSAVTNGSGVWGAATPLNLKLPFDPFGPIEMLASDYAGAAGAASDVLTPAARDALVKSMASQARRNIDDRYPAPVIVRVPDNSTLSPDVSVGFDQLVPGVWIPLRSSATCREIAQWQKLDSIDVDFVEGVEQVKVVMSPAPNGGDDDPDANSEAPDDQSLQAFQSLN